MDTYTIVWLVLMIVFLVVEASTVTMMSLWFAAGSLAALIVSMLGGGLVLQVVIFLVVSAVMLACLRPIARKHFSPRIKPTNIDSVIGSQGYATIPIDNLSATGQVKLGGMEWTARSTTGQPIAAGTLVKVDRIEGVKVFVTPVEVKATL